MGWSGSRRCSANRRYDGRRAAAVDSIEVRVATSSAVRSRTRVQNSRYDSVLKALAYSSRRSSAASWFSGEGLDAMHNLDKNHVKIKMKLQKFKSFFEILIKREEKKRCIPRQALKIFF